MTLDVYVILHANLGFSSIPVQDYPLVLDRCFWPVMAELEAADHLRLGLEFPASSLKWIADHDPSFITALSSLIDSGKAELVGSGLTQAITPLIPSFVGSKNLELGNELYQRIIGIRPRVAYSNEQTMSQGAARLYSAAGFDGLVVDWENASQSANLSPELRWSVPHLADSDLGFLWSSTVMFQRTQRVAYGQLDEQEYLDGIAKLQQPETVPLCIYSNDWEVFDYHPGKPPLPELLPSTPAQQLPRLLTLFREVSSSNLGRFILPSEVLDKYSTDREVHVGGASAPLVTKKQPKYNPARWALCGSTTSTVNTACAELGQRVERLHAMASANDSEALQQIDQRLVLLHASDLRTQVTHDKGQATIRSIGQLDALVLDLEHQQTGRTELAAVTITNTSGGLWKGWPISIDIALAPAEFPESVRLDLAGHAPLPQQIESEQRYPDGSLRYARIVVAGLALQEREAGCLSLQPTARPNRSMINVVDPTIRTPHVTLTVTNGRGATIARLEFPATGAPRTGQIPYGQLSPIHLTPDWYTGNVVIVDGDGNQTTDLSPVDVFVAQDPDAWPVRQPVMSQTQTGGVVFTRTTWVSCIEPRVDLDIVLDVPRMTPRSLHAGILSFDPSDLQNLPLSFATVNGGDTPDVYEFGSESIMQSASSSRAVSVSSCLGTTEGWAAILGPIGGVALHIDQRKLAGYALLEYEQTPEGPFIRLVPSFAETADTGSSQFRGRLNLGVSYEGFDKLDRQLSDDWHYRRIGVRVTGSRVAAQE